MRATAFVVRHSYTAAAALAATFALTALNPSVARAGSPSAAASPAETELAAKLAAAVKDVIAALPADLVKENTFAFGGPQHRYWHWVPTPLMVDKPAGKELGERAPFGRFGVPVEKMDTKAIEKLHDLLKAGLSGEGYRKVQLIIRQEGPSEPRQAFKGLARKPDWYFLTFFGEVGGKQWGFRFEGHHVSLTYEIEDGRVRFSPSMIGFNPSPLPPRAAELAMSLFGELGDEGRKTAHVVTGEKGVPADCSREPVAPAPVGLKLDKLGDEGKFYLTLLLEEYVANYPEALAKPVRKAIHAKLGELHFAWWGPLDHAKPHFYRLQGPGFLIEMRHQGGGSTAAHIHGVYRHFDDGSVNSKSVAAAK